MSGGGAILRLTERSPYDRGGGVSTIALVTAGCGSTTMLTGITIFEPGAALPLHFHNCEESVTVLEGHAVAVIDGHEHDLAVGDTTWLPAGVPHFFRNPSATQPMRILWSYASIDATRALVATNEMRRIDEEKRPRG